MNKNDIIGFIVYILTTILFGGAVALILLIIHEDNDRCHYYSGQWSLKDLTIGCVAIIIGLLLRYLFLQDNNFFSSFFQ